MCGECRGKGSEKTEDAKFMPQVDPWQRQPTQSQKQ